MQQKKIPMRKCVGCNRSKPKKELLRIVKSPDGEISVDTTGKKSGRGAYICTDQECFEKMRKSKRLDKTFEAPVPDLVYEEIERMLKDG